MHIHKEKGSLEVVHLASGCRMDRSCYALNNTLLSKRRADTTEAEVNISSGKI